MTAGMVAWVRKALEWTRWPGNAVSTSVPRRFSQLDMLDDLVA